MPFLAPDSPVPAPVIAEVLTVLFEVSLTGLVLIRPLYAPDDPARITDWTYLQLNPAAQRMLQLPECPTESFLTLNPGAVETGIFALHCATFHSNELGRYNVNYQHERLDNYYHFAGRRSGELLVLSFTDTADQDRSAVEQALRAAQAREQAATEAQRQRLHRLIAEAPALIASLRGPNHEVELANDSFRRMFGGRELLGRRYREAAPDLTGQPFFDRLDAVYRTGETYFGTDELMALDRTNSGRPEPFYASYIYQATRDEAGQIDGILIFASEVTDQVLARQERETQQQQLEELFMQAPVPIVILDGPALVFELVNPAYQQIFPGRELRGQPLLVAMPELVGTVIPDLFAHVYRTGESYVAQELPLMMTRHVGGPLEEIYWTFTYQARRDEHGAINGVFVFAHDVTDQVRTRQLVDDNSQQVRQLNQDLATANVGLTGANEALGRINQALRRTNGELDNFVYTASHDLRAPITNLEGLLTALREDLGPSSTVPGVTHLLALMLGAIERFKRTLDDLTDIAKLHDAHHAPATAVDLAALVEGVRLDLAPLLAATGGQLTVDVAPCPHLAFAEKNLRSVVYNLLSNALKYHHPDRVPLVQLRCRATPAATVLEVQDNGLGLDPGQQARLFGLFQRLHTHVEGSGVGLYMVKKIVEGVGGHLEVESQPGVGSTFRVFLPR